MRKIQELIQKIIYDKRTQELIIALKKKVNMILLFFIHLKDGIYEYFLPLFEMWNFWLSNPLEYLETLKNPFNNPWWSAAVTLPSFLGMIIHLVFWVINPAITDYIIMNFIW